MQPPEKIEQFNDNSKDFVKDGGGTKNTDDGKVTGGLGGFNVKGLMVGVGRRAPGKVASASSDGKGVSAGMGGAHTGFGDRGKGRQWSPGAPIPFESELAVTAALNWISRHQNSNGSWSLDGFNHQCTDKSCTGPGDIDSDAAATAMGLLPFLAAGETHMADCLYKKNIYKGLQFLVSNQQADGNLAGRGAYSLMYTHGLATIALCEAFGMTRDSRMGAAAQRALPFRRDGDPQGGGWRHTPELPGDTSVTGWQTMALKSGQMAGLKVSPETMRMRQEYF